MEYITLYRGIKQGYDPATTASGLTRWRGNLNELKNTVLTLERKYLQSTDEVQRTSVIQRMCLAHTAEADTSLFVPASTDIEYANKHAGDGKLLRLTVPFKYVVPVYKATQHILPGFQDEMEVAIAGRIEPEWVEFV